MSTEAVSRGRLSRWYHDRSLRSRMAILASVAVAVAIAICSTAAWFFAKSQVYQLQQDTLAGAPLGFRPLEPLGSGNTPAAAAADALHTYQGYTPQEQSVLAGSNRWDMQELNANGIVFVPVGPTPRAVKLYQSDEDLLNGPVGKTVYRLGSYTDGEPAMVRLTVVEVKHQPALVITASSLTKVDNSLQQLALILVVVAAVGVLIAGLVCRFVARAALRPVHDLTDVIEHMARTEEVGTTIPVHGTDEIARLSSAFNSMSTALANSRERQTRLIADAGHELRTPLTSLRTNVDLMIRSDDTGRPLPAATKTKLLGSMKAQMQELTGLIGDLLQLSRPDSPRPGQNVSVVGLHEIAQRAVERGKLRGPGLTFAVDLEPWYTRADAAALERAVMNLLDNAVKYSPPGGTIDVGLHHGRLTVRDHGPGIPADELQYVFDRFWRSPSSRQLPGSGLGLSIVAQTVQDSGGQVTLGPAQDGGPGALAVIRLPGASEPPPADTPSARPSDHPSDHPGQGQGPGQTPGSASS
ncbi:HAMP domain-containing sensor histidine kinase [Kitasatospora viridis]|uniref:histidine kinase n=1 Tax=Kitasatospora viridis TaxID=281105 RepID=A0A561UGJ8_9ACTN|nr:HAMP domain-containing sensor histidine kinase [Kitasatospora viridis]TWF98489.1 two-component system sensor histidine kinase MprB [Kitasatospora viridis]